MGYKYDNPSKQWVVWYSKRHPITRQPISLRRTGIKTEAEAKRQERELILSVEKRIIEKKKERWIDIVDNYFISAKEAGLSMNTIITDQSRLKVHVNPLWLERDITGITTSEIKDLINNKMKDFSVCQRRNTLKVIRAVFKHAVEFGKLNTNPTPQLKFKDGKKLKKVLTENEIRLFLNKAKELDWPWYPVWVMACYTGMRSGELYALTWDKVNLDTRHIKVDVSWNNKDGFKSTKSGDDRIVEIAPTLLTFLKEWKLKANDIQFVLPRFREWERGNQAEELRKFLVGIGLPEIRFHDLRASWATILLSKGIEPIKIMKMGGWTEYETMMIYIRKAGVDIKGISDCLNLHDPTNTTAQIISFPNVCS